MKIIKNSHSFAVIQWHFVAVMYSLYKNIRNEHRRHATVLFEPTTAQQDSIGSKV